MSHQQRWYQCLLLSIVVQMTLMCGIAVAKSVSPEAAFVPDDQTMLLLHLDGNADDAGLAEHHCTIRGEVAFEPGRFGQAIRLAGRGGIVINRSAALSPESASFTIEALIQPDPEQPRHASILSTGMSNGIGFQLRISNGRELVAQFSNGRAVYTASANLSDELFDGNWHHVAVVRDMRIGGRLLIYMDGRVVSRFPAWQPDAIHFADHRMPMVVGHTATWMVTSKDDGFRGLIDEVRVSRVARYDALNATDLILAAESTVIVTPDGPGELEQMAATLLSDHLRKRTGAVEGFNVSRESRWRKLLPRAQAVIHVGRTTVWQAIAPPDLHEHGYVLQRTAGLITIAGPTPIGTMQGVVAFLDRVCGVRFYGPGELLTHVPPAGQIGINTLAVRSEPYVHYATMSGLYNDGKAEARWAMLSGVDRGLIGSHHSHSMHARFPASRYADQYPGIYPIYDGKRYLPAKSDIRKWQPNFAAPELVDAALDSSRRWFITQPQAKHITFSVLDNNRFSQDPQTLAVQQEMGERPGLVHLHYRFLNNLAERLPQTLMQHGIETGKFIVALAYTKVREAPSFALSKRVLPVLVFNSADARIDRVLEAGGYLDKWAKVTQRVGQHDWGQGAGYFMPRIYTSLTQQVIQGMMDRGMHLELAHLEAYPNWGLDGAKLYITSKIWWDPSVNVAQLWDQYCNDMYGPAGGAMLAFYREAEKLFERLNDDHERKVFRYRNQYDLTPAQRPLVTQLRQHLDDAGRTAGLSPLQRERIELVSQSFRLTQMLFDFVNLPKRDGPDRKAILAYATQTLAGNPFSVYRKKDPQWMLDQLERALLANESRRQ